MKNFKTTFLLLFISLFLFISCEDDDALQKTDSLEDIGVLGKWEIKSRTTNGATDMTVNCCDFITFETGDDINDTKGEFQRQGEGYNRSGEFVVSTLEETFEFNFDNREVIYDFEISDDLITFTYSENDATIVEGWRKQ